MTTIKKENLKLKAKIHSITNIGGKKAFRPHLMLMYILVLGFDLTPNLTHSKGAYVHFHIKF